MTTDPLDLPTFEIVLEAARSEAALHRRPFFVALADGPASFSREDFLETQIQFLFAVVFFAEPMRLLADRLPQVPPAPRS